jgi:cytochrome b involved in lipid metabolism
MKKNKFTPFIVGAVVIVIALLVAYSTNSKNSSKYKPATQSQTPTTTTTPTPSTPTPPSAQGPKTYTLADISKHADRTNCWTTVSGSVYDVTAWISQHPGGAEAIISLCGRDGTAAFTEQHGGERRPANELAGFKIGTLK